MDFGRFSNVVAKVNNTNAQDLNLGTDISTLDLDGFDWYDLREELEALYNAKCISDKDWFRMVNINPEKLDRPITVSLYLKDLWEFMEKAPLKEMEAKPGFTDTRTKINNSLSKSNFLGELTASVAFHTRIESANHIPADFNISLSEELKSALRDIFEDYDVDWEEDQYLKMLGGNTYFRIDQLIQFASDAYTAFVC